MTDLEITRLCAKAMGYEVVQRNGRPTGGWWAVELCKHYDPLRNKAQCFELVEKWHIFISHRTDGLYSAWTNDDNFTAGADLRRCVCECVAKM